MCVAYFSFTNVEYRSKRCKSRDRMNDNTTGKILHTP